jgi:hypothetical protein
VGAEVDVGVGVAVRVGAKVGVAVCVALGMGVKVRVAVGVEVDTWNSVGTEVSVRMLTALGVSVIPQADRKRPEAAAPLSLRKTLRDNNSGLRFEHAIVWTLAI